MVSGEQTDGVKVVFTISDGYPDGGENVLSCQEAAGGAEFRI
jgi:hypothetical protein